MEPESIRSINGIKVSKRKYSGITLLLFLIFISSCAQKQVEFHVTKPAKLKIENVKNLAIGHFENQLGLKIPLPNGKELKDLVLLKSNKDVSDLLRARLLGRLSKGSDFRIINTTGKPEGITGLVPNASETGVIQAKVRYYEQIIEGRDNVFHVLLIKNENLPMKDRLAVLGGATLVAMAAEKSGKGFKVPIPFVEQIAAIEVEFDFVRQSDGSKIIPTQIFRNYFHKKWGGDDSKSKFIPELVSQISGVRGDIRSFVSELEGLGKSISQKITDPQEFEAKGLHLKNDPNVPWVSLDIQNFIVVKVAAEFARKISKYHEVAKLIIASGDEKGVILIQGNAYEMAINHLENLPKPLSTADSYNLGLAYEAIGEFSQAEKHYLTGLKSDASNQNLKKARLRVKR